jgi:ABC-2 type transport system permease protein
MTPAAVTVDGAVAEPRARFRDLAAAEWIKYRSLRSTPWSLLISALAVLAFNAGAAWNQDRYWRANGVTPARFIADGLPLQDAFTANACIVMMVAAGAIGTLAITGEYGTGLIRTTFAAVPARRSVLAAKAVVIVAVTSVLGAVAAAASFGLTQLILSSHQAGVSIGHPGAWRVVVASALLAPLSALVGAAVGAVIRHSAAAVAGTIVILAVVPVFIQASSHISAVIAHALPFQAWNRLVAIPFDSVETYPWTITGAWTVLAAWTLAAAVVTVATAKYRDV